jgi:hypothetical protein
VTAGSGVRALLGAVLLLTLHDVKQGHHPGALEWVESDADEGPFDFVSLCDHLALDYRVVRESVRRGPCPVAVLVPRNRGPRLGRYARRRLREAEKGSAALRDAINSNQA